jgi:hypothetical protein
LNETTGYRGAAAQQAAERTTITTTNGQCKGENIETQGATKKDDRRQPETAAKNAKLFISCKNCKVITLAPQLIFPCNPHANI